MTRPNHVLPVARAGGPLIARGRPGHHPATVAALITVGAAALGMALAFACAEYWPHTLYAALTFLTTWTAAAWIEARQPRADLALARAAVAVWRRRDGEAGVRPVLRLVK